MLDAKTIGMELKWVWRKEIFDYLTEKMNLKRFNSVVDLGCAEAYFKHAINPQKYVGVGLLNDPLVAEDQQKFKIDVTFDIDTKEKWPFEDNEFDLVIASQVLEHIFHLDEACKEMKRITSSHILIGLPNDMRVDNRIFGLFGKNPIGIKKYGHCKLFDIPLAKAWIKEKFVDENYECEKVMYFYTIIGQRFVPKFLKRFLANLYPNLFAGEIYFLLKKSIS